MEETNTNNDIGPQSFTEEDKDILALTRKLRVDMIKENTKDGYIPTRGGDMRVLNEIANSLDTQVMSVADTKNKETANKNTDDMFRLIAENIRQSKLNDANSSGGPQIDIHLDGRITSDKLVPGQMDINPDKLSVKDFAGGEADE